MTKILSARDLLELLRQPSDQDPAEETSSESRGRRIYTGDARTESRSGGRDAEENRELLGVQSIAALSIGANISAAPKRRRREDDDEEEGYGDMRKTLEIQLPTQPIAPAAPPAPRIPAPLPAPRAPTPHRGFEPPVLPEAPRAPELPRAPVPPEPPRSFEAAFPPDPFPPSGPPSTPRHLEPPRAPVAPTPPKAPVPPRAPEPPRPPEQPRLSRQESESSGPPSSNPANQLFVGGEPVREELGRQPFEPEPTKPKQPYRGPRNTEVMKAVRPEDPSAILAAISGQSPEVQKSPTRASVQGWARPGKNGNETTTRTQPRAQGGQLSVPADPKELSAKERAQYEQTAPNEQPPEDLAPLSSSSQQESELPVLSDRAVLVDRYPHSERQMPGAPTLIDMPMPNFGNGVPVGEEPVALSGDETLVLLNYDRSVNIDAVAKKSGLPVAKVGLILKELHTRGVIDGVTPEFFHSGPLPAATPASRPIASATPASSAKARVPSLEEMAEDANLADAHHHEKRAARDKTPIESDTPSIEIDPPSSRSRESFEGASDEIIEEDGASEPEEDPASGADATNYLQLYETVYSKMPLDLRAEAAANKQGADLFALSYDKDPGVARALWENLTIGMDVARFAAFHHRTAFGLDRMSERGDFMRDAQVQRRLIRNPVINENLLRRLLMPKRLVETYKVTLDREVPERTRSAARTILRTKFATAEPDDRVQLIWNTEGRVLINLAGLTIDSKSTAIICGRPIVSLMLVQNFCRFAATPPAIIHHCLKQPFIRRQIPIRNMLLKHPNCPSEAKRIGG